jgi:hypothetical protein
MKKISEEQYFDRRNRLRDTQIDQGKQFDQYVFGISSGVFGVSFAFINDIVKTINKDIVWILITAWSINLINILTSLVSYLIVYYAYKRQIHNWDLEYDGVEVPKNTLLSKVCEILNIINFCLLFLGFTFLLVFVALSLGGK